MYEYLAFGVVYNRTIPTIMLYEISDQKGLVMEMSLTDIRAIRKSLIISLRQTDESLFAESGITTLSLPTLISIAGESSFSVVEIDDLIRKTTGINYSQIFWDTKGIDYSRLFQSKEFWRKIARFARECMDILQNNGLMDFLLLEAKFTPILHKMFDAGFPVDAKRVQCEYEELKRTLSVIGRKMGDGTDKLAELEHLRLKVEDKIRRIPFECLKAKKSKVILYSNFRSIGTDTFRISTNHINIQGLPKDIRNCLLPRKGDLLVEYDLTSSQIIILACLSGESSLVEAYTKGEDLYLKIVSVLIRKQEKEIVEEEREVYKRIILQMIYGAGKRTIQKELKGNGINISYSDVCKMQKQFNQFFTAIEEYCHEVKTADWIRLPTGRIWKLKDSIEPYKRLAYILQYMESTILREALVLIDHEIEGKEIWLYLCIHDSVLLETKSVQYTEMRDIVYQCFNKALKKYFGKLKQVRIKENVLYEK